MSTLRSLTTWCRAFGASVKRHVLLLFSELYSSWLVTTRKRTSASVCYTAASRVTSLPKVIWEEGRVAAAVPGGGWHKGLRIRNVCIVLVKDRCANVRYFSVRQQD